MTAQGLAEALGGRRVGSDWMGRCPSHDDRNPSLAIKEGDGGRLLVHCHAGCDQADVVAALQDRGLYLSPERSYAPPVNGNAHHDRRAPLAEREPEPRSIPAEHVRASLIAEGWRVVAEFPYGPDLRNVRFEHATRIDVKKGRPEKSFRWEHRRDGVWWSGGGGLPRPLYLNSVCQRDQVECVLGLEGEGKADLAGTLGIPAFSYRHVSPEAVSALSGFAKVVLWPDRDAAGAKLAETAAKLIGEHVRDVRMIEPPASLPESGDIVDAVQSGMDAAGVLDLMRQARRVGGGPQIRSFADIPLLETIANRKIDWLVDGLVAKGTLTCISGAPGCGKSTVATAICGAIATGTPFAGRETQQAPVLILDRENPAGVVFDRCQRLRIHDGEYFKIWGGWCPEEAPAPNSPMLVEWIAAANPKPVILVDSLVAFMAGDENSANDTRVFFHGLRRLADAGATVIVLHHTGKSETAKDYRGSSDIPGVIDVGLRLCSHGEVCQLGRLSIKAWKARFPVTPEWYFTYVEGQFVSEGDAPAKTVTELLVELLKQNAGIGVGEFEQLAGDKGLGRNKGRNWLEEGVRAGVIKRETGARNRLFHTWVGVDDQGIEEGLFDD